MNVVSLLFGFSGRINRVQYWLGCVIAGVSGAVLFFMLALMTMPSGGLPKTGPGMMQALATLGFAFALPLVLMCWAATALQTKRFHDRGRSGLWALAPLVPMMMITVSVVSGVIGGQHPEQVVASIGMWLLLLQVINIAIFVDVGCMPGKPEPNKYGNPPGGGFSGGGAPTSNAPIPGKAKPAAQPIPGMGSTLVGAENAIERAIAAREKQSLAPAPQPTARASVRAAASAPAAPTRPATPGSFGRKVTQ